MPDAAGATTAIGTDITGIRGYLTRVGVRASATNTSMSVASTSLPWVMIKSSPGTSGRFPKMSVHVVSPAAGVPRRVVIPDELATSDPVDRGSEPAPQRLWPVRCCPA